MLKKYPDIMTIDQMCSVLGISTKTGYKLIHNGTINATKVGRSFRIPKIHLLAYLKVVARNEKSVDKFAFWVSFVLRYICVNEMGERFKPNYLSNGFKRILRDNSLREIRFHDLRHSCASPLLANRIPMKMIQEWLGHSDFATTANLYAHLEYESKLTSADAMQSVLNLPPA